MGAETRKRPRPKDPGALAAPTVKRARAAGAASGARGRSSAAGAARAAVSGGTAVGAYRATTSASTPPPSVEALRSWGRAGAFFFDGARLHLRQLERLREIAGFFTEEVLTKILVPVAMQTFDVSLRVLDYTCTNYAKKTRVLAQTAGGGAPRQLFSLYKDWLRHYRRKTFDPFRRRERIFFQDPQSKEVLDTTVAQLNFLRWALAYGILDYVRQHARAIEVDMMTTLADSKRRREAQDALGLARRRAELSRAPPMKCIVYAVEQRVVFE